MSRRRRLAAAIAAGGVLALVVGQSAAAHISIDEPIHVAGAYTVLTFSVPHGCEGSATTEVRIQMPESIPSVTPTVNPNWDVEEVMATLEEPIEVEHGEPLTERDAEVVYTAKTPLPDGLRDAFELSMQMPADAAGQTLYFPVIQTCEQGETAWIEIPEAGQDAEELEAPAPSIQVVAADAAPDAAAADASDAALADGATASAESDDDGGSSNGLAIAALVAGIGGILLGGAAFLRGRTH